MRKDSQMLNNKINVVKNNENRKQNQNEEKLHKNPGSTFEKRCATKMK